MTICLVVASHGGKAVAKAQQLQIVEHPAYILIYSNGLLTIS